jgi:hypothetical protein
MTWCTMRTHICKLTGLEFKVSAKYRVPDDCKGDAFFLFSECEIGKNEFKGMSCPFVRKQSKCPFEDSIPRTLPQPY